jgi:hypothetical protein
MSTLKDNLPSSASGAARVVAWILAIAIVVLSVVPGDLRPETELPHYLRNLGLLASFLFLFAGLVEIAQLFQAGRHARINDFLVDTFALWVGLICVAFVKKLWQRFAKSNG